MPTLAPSTWATLLPHSTAQSRASAFITLQPAAIKFIGDGGVIRTITTGQWTVGAQKNGRHPLVPGLYTDPLTGSGTPHTAVFENAFGEELLRCTCGKKPPPESDAPAPEYALLDDIVAGVPVERFDFAIDVRPPLSQGEPVAVIAPPVLAGTSTVGSVIGVTLPVVSGNPPPTITLEWLRDGVVMPGETGTTLPPRTESDVGSRYQVRATISNGVSPPVVSLSNVIGPIVGEVLDVSGAPAVIDVVQGASTDLEQYIAAAHPPISIGIDAGSLPAGVTLADNALSAEAEAPPVTSGDVVFFVVDSAVDPWPGGLPAYLAEMPVMTWSQIADTRLRDIAPADPGGRPTTTMLAESGSALQIEGSRVWTFGGGHYDGFSNAVYCISLDDDAPAWDMRIGPTDPIQWDVSHYADGRPTSRHSYTQVQWCEQRQLLMFAGCSASAGSGTANFRNMDAFDPAVDDWLPKDTLAPTLVTPPAATATVQAPNGDIYNLYPSGQLQRWREETGQWTQVAQTPSTATNVATCFDPVRNRIVRLGAVSGRRFLDPVTGEVTQITLTGPQADQIDRHGHALYCEHLDAYLYVQHGRNPKFVEGPMRIFRIDPVTWEVTLLPVAGDGPLISAGNTGGYSRFNYVHKLRALYYFGAGGNVFIIRLI